MISKAVIAVGGILILAMTMGMVRFDPMVMIGAIAATIGGTVVFGSNTSTSKQTVAAMKASEVLIADPAPFRPCDVCDRFFQVR